MIQVDYDQADWGSQKRYPDGGLPGLWVPDKGVAHWGGDTIPPTTIEGVMALWRGWQNYHIHTKRWRDIAYNYGFDNLGKRYRLRGWNPSGATSGDYEHDGIPENNEAVAIVWAGGAGGTMTDAAWWALDDLVNQVIEVIGISPAVVIGHRDVKGVTRCPGRKMLKWIHNRGWETAAPPPPPEEEDMDYQKIINEWGQDGLYLFYDLGWWKGSKVAGTVYYLSGEAAQSDKQGLVETVLASSALLAAADLVPTLPADVLVRGDSVKLA